MWNELVIVMFNNVRLYARYVIISHSTLEWFVNIIQSQMLKQKPVVFFHKSLFSMLFSFFSAEE